jgi:hypothetical protein
MNDIGVKDFSMIEFLSWLDKNKDNVSFIDLNQVDTLASCRVSMKDNRVKTLRGCGAMGVREAHEKICDAFDIDKERKITDIKIHVCYDGVPEIVIKELKVD